MNLKLLFKRITVLSSLMYFYFFGLLLISISVQLSPIIWSMIPDWNFVTLLIIMIFPAIGFSRVVEKTFGDKND